MGDAEEFDELQQAILVAIFESEVPRTSTDATIWSSDALPLSFSQSQRRAALKELVERELIEGIDGRGDEDEDDKIGRHGRRYQLTTKGERVAGDLRLGLKH